MMEEHTARSDSKKEFKSPNYGVTTTSEVEWKFVAKPDDPVEHWPREEKLVHYIPKRGGSGSQRLPKLVHRSPMLLPQLQSEMDERNRRLREMKEPELVLEEALGARLYTGPLFVKYNAVLRGLDSDGELHTRSCLRCSCKKYLCC